MRKRIVFLDIDGVLNNLNVLRAANRFDAMGAQMVQSLKSVFDEVEDLDPGFEVSIVISSVWRHGSEATWDLRIREALAESGWENPPIIGRTPTISDARGEEIHSWLVSHFGEDFEDQVLFAIVDDDVDDMLFEQRHNIIKCDSATGFTGHEREALLRLLFAFTQEEWIDVIGHMIGFENIFVLDRESSVEEVDALIDEIAEIHKRKRNGPG